MPSTIVHLALAGLLAAALLGEAYDKKALLVVFGVTAIPDLDSFIALVSSVGHRAALHTMVIPIVAAGLLVFDLRIREHSFVKDSWGAWGVRVAWVCILAYAFAHVALDMTDGIVNLFWPVHDQFYQLEGKLEISDQRGIVQTFVDWSGSMPTLEGVGTTDEIQLDTGVDPDPTGDDPDAERIFPVFRAGWQLLLFVVGALVMAARFRISHALSETNANEQ